MKRAILYGVIALTSVLSCRVVAADWQEIRSNEAKFSVSFPGKPALETSPAPCQPCSDIKKFIFRTPIGNYSVAFATFVGTYSIEMGKAAYVSNHDQGTLRSERRFTLGNAQAIEFFFDTSRGAGRTIIVARDNTVYIVNFIGRRGEETSPDTARFIQSFRFLP